MKKLIQVFILILSASIADAQIKDEGPKAYFGYPGPDSMKRADLVKYDTLKMDNQNLKVLRFCAALSAYDCKSCTSDVTVIRVEGNTISSNQGLFNSLKIKQSGKTLITVMDIEFINSQGKLIKYPKEFSFKLYE
jgi:hypothetical protein